jgi:hypothetical protein
MDNIIEFLSSKTTIIIAVFAALFVLERLFPVVQWIGGAGRVVKNLCIAAFNFVASPLIVIPIAAYATSHALDWRPVFWSGGLGLILDLLLLHFCGGFMRCITSTKCWIQPQPCGFTLVKWFCRRWCVRW